MVTADMTRIFQIGFNKCGTRSIGNFFKRHGLETADWALGDLARSIKADLAAGATPLRDWPDVNVFLDMEFVHPVHMIEGYKYFRELQAHYPDALFILNTRNGEAWIRSRNAHGKGSYTNAYRRFYGYDGIDRYSIGGGATGTNIMPRCCRIFPGRCRNVCLCGISTDRISTPCRNAFHLR